jgi:Restriction endonuclease
MNASRLLKEIRSIRVTFAPDVIRSGVRGQTFQTVTSAKPQTLLNFSLSSSGALLKRHHHHSSEEGWKRLIPRQFRPSTSGHHRPPPINRLRLPQLKLSFNRVRSAPASTAYPKAPADPKIATGLGLIGVVVGGGALYFWLADFAESEQWEDTTILFANLALFLTVFVALSFVGLLHWRARGQHGPATDRWERTITRLKKKERRDLHLQHRLWRNVRQSLNLPEPLDHHAHTHSVRDLEIDWIGFVQLALNTYTRLGYTVTSLEKIGIDGIDLQIESPQEGRALVLCRYWQDPLDDREAKHLLDQLPKLEASHLYVWGMKGFTSEALTAWGNNPTVTFYNPDQIDALVERAYGMREKG